VSGRAAWEAFRAARDAGMDSGYGPDTFDEMHADWWDAAAQAAIDESDSTALAQLAMAREAIDDLAAERDRLTERVAELVSEGNQLRAELDAATDALAGNPDPLVAFLQSQVDHFRELAAEILAPAMFKHTAAGNWSALISDAERSGFIERAGLAIATAGTEYLAEQLAETSEAGT
jgi:hypothetical protein